MECYTILQHLYLYFLSNLVDNQQCFVKDVSHKPPSTLSLQFLCQNCVKYNLFLCFIDRYLLRFSVLSTMQEAFVSNHCKCYFYARILMNRIMITNRGCCDIFNAIHRKSRGFKSVCQMQGERNSEWLYCCSEAYISF